MERIPWEPGDALCGAGRWRVPRCIGCLRLSCAAMVIGREDEDVLDTEPQYKKDATALARIHQALRVFAEEGADHEAQQEHFAQVPPETAARCARCCAE